MKFNGRNVHISKKARLGENVRIGDNTVIHDNVHIGANTTICDNCEIGEPTADYYSDPAYRNAPTVIGADALIRSGSIIYAGVTIGQRFETGHRVTIREACLIGDNCSIGTHGDLQGQLTIGHNCRLHSSVHLCRESKLGDQVFMYPFSVLLNDRYPPSTEVAGPEIGDFTQIGAHAVVVGQVSIGNHCLIAANATVTSDFDDHSFLLGSPAKRRSDVRELRSEDGIQLYPWKQRFSRNMPWEDADKDRSGC